MFSHSIVVLIMLFSHKCLQSPSAGIRLVLSLVLVEELSMCGMFFKAKVLIYLYVQTLLYVLLKATLHKLSALGYFLHSKTLLQVEAQTLK